MTTTRLPRLPDLSITVPSSWRRRTDLDRGVAMSARAPSVPTSGVRPDLVLRTAPVDDTDVIAWRTDALGELADVLVDFALEDDDLATTDGHDVVYHRFAHRVGAADVLCDQWSWLVDGTGITLTCSAARADYAAYSELFEDIAATVDVGAPGQADQVARA